jgi:hypothetical protein
MPGSTLSVAITNSGFSDCEYIVIDINKHSIVNIFFMCLLFFDINIKDDLIRVF